MKSMGSKEDLLPDVQKTFFRRPFWKPENLLYYKIFSVSFLSIVSLVFLSMHFVDKLPDQQIFKNIKKIYITRFLNNLTRDEQEVMASAPSTQKEMNLAMQSGFSERTTPQSNPVSPLESLNLNNIKPLPEAPKFDPALEAVINNKTQHFQQISTIVDNVTSLVTAESAPGASPLQPILRRKAEAEKNLKVFNPSKKDHEITIKPPEITDFGVIKGYRKYQETLSLSNENKEFIQYCVEKFNGGLTRFKGNIVVQFDIHPDGYVIPESIKIIKTDIKDPRILQCIKKNIRRWRNFPKVAYEMGTYTITQKYIF